MLSYKIVLDSLLNAVYTTSSGGSSAELDTAKSVGDIFINVSARASGTNTTSVTVEHSDTSGSGFAAIPASALFNPNTGLADTFANITTTAYDSYLGVQRQQLKRYLRVTFAGTSITQNVAVVAAYQQQQTQEN